MVQVGQHGVQHDEQHDDRLVQGGRITMMMSCWRSVVQVVQNETVRSRRRPAVDESRTSQATIAREAAMDACEQRPCMLQTRGT